MRAFYLQKVSNATTSRIYGQAGSCYGTIVSTSNITNGARQLGKKGLKQGNFGSLWLSTHTPCNVYTRWLYLPLLK